jgi:hypothetical protein
MVFPRLGLQSWIAVAYAPVVFLMFYTASSRPRQIRNAANILIISNLLLGVYLSFWAEPIVHILHAVLFGISMMLLTPHQRVKNAE